jgi:hypothetical protein
MIKHIVLAAVSVSMFSVAPLPGITGSAFAQPCGPNSTYCPPQPSGSTYDCTTDLGHLRRVYEEELEGIENPNRVSVVPVCAGESYGVMRSAGNAGALRQAVADNDAMTEALFLKNFVSDDVVGIRMTGIDSVILYVSTFLR